MRRLTRDQFNNTVADLIGASGEPANAIAPDEKIGPFHSNAIAPITDLIVEQHQEVAKLLAADATTRMGTLAACDLNADSTGTCARQFIEDFGLRAYRRPLEAAEVDKYVALYDLGTANGGASHGFELVLQAMLQSPFFLYHVELGGASTPSQAPIAVTAYELAARLSYFIYNSMPDAPLFELAASGDLANEATLTGEVERMIQSDAAGRTIALFHKQWLGLEKLPDQKKDAGLFPAYSGATVDAMLEETGRFADSVIRQGDGSLLSLFTASYGFPQGDLFGIYGVAEPAGFVPGTRVDFDPAQRSGILTQAAFLATNAHANQTSPVHRGIIVRENVLCQPIDSPPADANTTVPPPTEATTTRERFAQHEANAVCANCHKLMDPIGLGFENYDPIGAWRTNDGLSEVDASGEFVEVAEDLAGPFNGPLELSVKLANSQEVRLCLENQWFRFALGRTESNADACSLQVINDRFEASGGNIRSLIAEIARSEAFRNVRSQE
ncbi:MAG TPA: DUF1588 domain-containing protein [Polyangiaceae bacterium]|nr:DUF1588 domain-containing protein [Polyangiaceae bacterium]